MPSKTPILPVELKDILYKHFNILVLDGLDIKVIKEDIEKIKDRTGMILPVSDEFLIEDIIAGCQDEKTLSDILGPLSGVGLPRHTNINWYTRPQIKEFLYNVYLRDQLNETEVDLLLNLPNHWVDHFLKNSKNEKVPDRNRALLLASQYHRRYADGYRGQIVKRAYQKRYTVFREIIFRGFLETPYVPYMKLDRMNVKAHLFRFTKSQKKWVVTWLIEFWDEFKDEILSDAYFWKKVILACRWTSDKKLLNSSFEAFVAIKDTIWE